MARRHPTVVIFALATAGLAIPLLASCAGSSTLITQSNDSGHVLMSDARHADAVSGAEVEGTLAVVGSCFGLETSSGDFAAVFPQGSGIVENTDHVEIPGWGTLGLGNQYKGSGRILDSATLSYHDAIPAGCQAGRTIVLDPIR